MRHNHEFDSFLVCFYCDEVDEKCVGECQARKLTVREFPMELPKDITHAISHINASLSKLEVLGYLFDAEIVPFGPESDRWRVWRLEVVASKIVLEKKLQVRECMTMYSNDPYRERFDLFFVGVLYSLHKKILDFALKQEKEARCIVSVCGQKIDLKR